MESKVIAFLAFLCIVQNIDTKPMSPFWNMNPYMAPQMDPTLRPLIMDIQMRLSQASSLSKSTIGMNVGIASKSIGMATSTSKMSVKALVNGLQNNPNTSKDCLTLHKDAIDMLNTDSKNQVSFCSKSSQLQLKSMNQVQKELSFQVTSLTSELNLGINQCKMENPLVTDTAAVTDCVTLKADEIREKLTTLEATILDTVSAVNTGVSQIIDGANSCTQQVQQQVQEQAAAIAEQLETCDAALTPA